MNFNAPLLRPIRILLFPFSLVYGLIIWIRNKLFDKGYVSSTEFNLPLIGVGNISVGGTGKSPMVECLVSLLSNNYTVAVLSRGYKRKTKGYALVSAGATALEIGDEPMHFYNKFPDVTIAVGEERIVAIPQLLHDRPETQVIILDDAFQHRSVRAGIDIVLTDYNNLFTRDWFLPTGDLRDNVSSYKRADILIVTKCPDNIDETEKLAIEKELNPMPNQQLFFTSIKYGQPYHIITGSERPVSENDEVLLVSGIANPKPLKKYLDDHCESYSEILYEDHHIFSIDDWKDMQKKFNSISSDNKIILTTEKDAVRLMKFQQSMDSYPFYVLPMQVHFLFGEEQAFTDLITKFIAGFIKKNENDKVLQ